MSRKLLRKRERKIKRLVGQEARAIRSYLSKRLVNSFFKKLSKAQTITPTSLKILSNETIISLIPIYPDFIHRRAMAIYRKSAKEIVSNFAILKERAERGKLRETKARRKTKKATRLKNLHLYGIYIKDTEALDQFLLTQALGEMKEAALVDYSMSKHYHQKIYGNSLIKINNKFHKELDKAFSEIKEEALRDLPVAEQRSKLQFWLRPRVRRLGVNYAALVANQYPRTQIIKASSVGVKTLKKAKKFKTWNSYFDDLVRFTHAQMNLVTILDKDMFEVPNPNGGIELAVGPRDPNLSPENLINCRCSLTYEIYKP